MTTLIATIDYEIHKQQVATTARLLAKDRQLATSLLLNLHKIVTKAADELVSVNQSDIVVSVVRELL